MRQPLAHPSLHVAAAEHNHLINKLESMDGTLTETV